MNPFSNLNHVRVHSFVRSYVYNATREVMGLIYQDYAGSSVHAFLHLYACSVFHAHLFELVGSFGSFVDMLVC